MPIFWVGMFFSGLGVTIFGYFFPSRSANFFGDKYLDFIHFSLIFGGSFLGQKSCLIFRLSREWEPFMWSRSSLIVSNCSHVRALTRHSKIGDALVFPIWSRKITSCRRFFFLFFRCFFWQGNKKLDRFSIQFDCTKNRELPLEIHLANVSRRKGAFETGKTDSHLDSEQWRAWQSDIIGICLFASFVSASFRAGNNWNFFSLVEEEKSPFGSSKLPLGCLFSLESRRNRKIWLRLIGL